MVRDQLAQGTDFVLIHRSKPIAYIQPIKKMSLNKRFDIRSIAGGRNFEEKLGRKLTPEYLNKIGEERYG